MDGVKGRREQNKIVEQREEEEMMGLRRGPWTAEEDFTLINYIALHGEGRWNTLSRSAGLKRTGKSCRLRWLNYLRPDVRRGNITLEEQLLILELHSRWGNRWSKIAQYLPGRTDNEIKNYWRTRVQKHAKQLKCDVNSKQFKDTMRYLWMPMLLERIQAASSSSAPTASSNDSTCPENNHYEMDVIITSKASQPQNNIHNIYGENVRTAPAYASESYGTAAVSPISESTDCYYPVDQSHSQNYLEADDHLASFLESLTSPSGYVNQGLDFSSMEASNHPLLGSGDISDNSWNVEDVWFLQQQFGNDLY